VRRPSAAAGSALFFAVAPAVVAGAIPYALTGWEVDAEWWLPLRILGAALVVAGAAALIQAFVRFVVEGLGTPAPVAPTEHLVVGGPYRYVRNVMYIAVTTTIAGQALLLGSPGLLVYAAVVWTAMAAFVKAYEEPTLARRYGAQYEEYRRAVPAWWPRFSGSRWPSSSPSRRGPSRRRR
jgi:protein-S-isoprenylcysteine O-methyltransferase Ste14